MMDGSLYLLKIVSISAVSSAGRGRGAVIIASISSFSCSREVEPMIELVTNGRSRTNPRASSTGVRPCFLANSIYCTVASWDARNIEHKNKLAVIDTTWCSKQSTKCSQKTDSKIVIHLKYTITCEKCSCSWISICVCVCLIALWLLVYMWKYDIVQDLFYQEHEKSQRAMFL